jgi:hypothetical protein
VLSRKGMCTSRPDDDRRIASAAVCVTSCKRAVFLLCQRVLAPASERAPRDGWDRRHRRYLSWLQRRGKLSVVMSWGLSTHAVTDGCPQQEPPQRQPGHAVDITAPIERRQVIGGLISEYTGGGPASAKCQVSAYERGFGTAQGSRARRSLMLRSMTEAGLLSAAPPKPLLVVVLVMGQ